MNLLFVLLKNIEDALREKLKAISPRGTMGMVWSMINEQVAQGEFDKKEILAKTGISSSHLDKITSELLSKCYATLFGDDSTALLDFLSIRVVFIKLFYSELARLAKTLPAIGDKQQQADFIRRCFRMTQANMPIVYRDDKASAKLAKLYISLFNGDEKKEAEFYMGCTLLLERMEMLFAATDFGSQADMIAEELAALGSPLPYFGEDVVFAYYWTKIYFYHAQEKFSIALEVAQKAVIELMRFKSEKNKLNMLRVESKVNELLYYLSRFDEAYEGYHSMVNSRVMDMLPERPYHLTKYAQLGMITGHLDEAAKVLAEKLDPLGDKLEEQIMARDIVTYVKYCLFKDDYDRAFRFIQLGFEKNPKGKYFQYEIELRNLQTACFFLSHQQDVALEMCRKHIKFLRNHGYTTANSDYPFFYILVKAIFDKNIKGGLSPRHQKMLDHYQQGSYAIYGRLLLKMLKRQSGQVKS